MSNGRRPVIRVTAKMGQQAYSIFSVWKGNYAGTYSISRDKGTEKAPPLGLFDALKAWGKGEAYLNVSVESEREPRNGGQRRDPAPVDAGDFNDSDGYPF